MRRRMWARRWHESSCAWSHVTRGDLGTDESGIDMSCDVGETRDAVLSPPAGRHRDDGWADATAKDCPMGNRRGQPGGESPAMPAPIFVFRIRQCEVPQKPPCVHLSKMKAHKILKLNCAQARTVAAWRTLPRTSWPTGEVARRRAVPRPYTVRLRATVSGLCGLRAPREFFSPPTPREHRGARDRDA